MALSLGRKVGESLHFIHENGEEIKIEFDKGHGDFDNFVKVRIQAPNSVKIVRGELHDSNS